MRLLLATILAIASISAACGGPDDRAEVELVAGAREEQTPEVANPESTAESAPVGPRALLPDLVVRQPGDLWIQSGDDGMREIRFSTSVANIGEGPLEMRGRYDPANNLTIASQRVLHVDGTVTESEIGRFILHDEHEHWHFEDFSVFELWSVDGDGQPDGIVATTGKQTFCLVDAYPVAEPPPTGVTKPSILECNSNVQGLSSGWEETYDATFQGQELDIPNVPDGVYLIRTVVDPDNRVRESDDGNNESKALVEITGFTIAVLQEL